MQHAMMRFACAAALALALCGCGKGKDEAKEKEGAEGPTHVLVETASRGALDRVIVTDAVLYPVNQANVTSKLSAPVRRVLVNRGDHVKAGQVLLELEAADLAASANESKHQLEQAQAQYQTLTGATVPEERTKAQADVRSAEQQLEAAKKLYESRAALQKEGALAQKLVDEAKVAMVQAQSALDTAQRHLQALSQVSQRESIAAAQAQVNAAKSHNENAAVQLSYAQVRSPISGIVADRPVYPGEMPAAGSALVSIVDVSQIVARANVPVKDAAALKPGRPARFSTPTGDIPGKVTVVSPSADPNTTTVEVWVEAANPEERLKPGDTVRVSIIAETITDTIVVPAAALLNADDGTPKVMVITADNVAHERHVKTGVRQGARVQIVSGVQEGEQVVVSGGLGLEDKAKVKVDQPKPEDEEENTDEEKPAAGGEKDKNKEKQKDKKQ